MEIHTTADLENWRLSRVAVFANREEARIATSAKLRAALKFSANGERRQQAQRPVVSFQVSEPHLSVLAGHTTNVDGDDRGESGAARDK
jgi:hypothetical protein